MAADIDPTGPGPSHGTEDHETDPSPFEPRPADEATAAAGEGVEGWLNDDPESESQTGGEGPGRSTSVAQINANRENAKHSTGPKTAVGKRQSSKNATRHGVFSRHGYPILRGAFAEDPDELDSFVEGVVAALRPQDEVQSQQARQIAVLYVRLRRLEALEVHCMSHDAELDDALRAAVSEGEMYGDLVDTATHLHGYLSNEIPYDEVDFKQLAIFVRSEIDRDIEVEALWTKDRRPQTSAEWRAACNSLINHFWPDDASAAAWANDRRLEYLQDLKQAEDEVRDVVAKQILAGSLEKTTVLGARLGRELERQQKLLRVMQSKEDEG